MEDEKGRTTTTYVMDLKGRLVEMKEERSGADPAPRVASRATQGSALAAAQAPHAGLVHEWWRP